MLKKLLTGFIPLLFLTILFSFRKDLPDGAPGNERNFAIKTIVVDAGHGGSDVGARGAYSFEKDICLGVALKLGKLLEDEFKDVKILYTRTTDVYPAIKE